MWDVAFCSCALVWGVVPDGSVHVRPFVSQCVVQLRRLACHPVVYRRFHSSAFIWFSREHCTSITHILNMRHFIYFLKYPHKIFILKMRKLRHTVSNWQRAGICSLIPGTSSLTRVSLWPQLYRVRNGDWRGGVGWGGLTTSCYLWWWQLKGRGQASEPRYKSPEKSILILSLSFE